MSHDTINAQNLEYRPLTLLNTIHGRSSHGVKAQKVIKEKESKPSVELCDVKIGGVTMDLELANRLISIAIDQFLFFTNQVPFPVSRLATLPTVNAKAIRLRNDFLAAHARLLDNIKSVLRLLTDSAEGQDQHLIRIVVSLGSAMTPKAMMLFQIPAMQEDAAGATSPILIARIHRSTDSETQEIELPSDSDSDHGQLSEDYESLKVLVKPQPPNRTSHSTPPLFTPFCDTDAADNPTLDSEPVCHVQSALNLSSPLPNPLTPISPPISSLPLSTPPPIGDENRNSKSRLDKRYRTAERELTVALSNLDLFTEEIELSKIRVYMQAPRIYSDGGWHPRPSVAGTLDSLVNYPHVDTSAKSKLAKTNACAIRVTPTDRQHNDAVSLRELNNVEDRIWLEWDGKLTGVE